MKTTGIATPLIGKGDDLVDIFAKSLERPFMERSLVVITSKVVAVSQGRVRQYASDADFEQIIRDEADEVFGNSNTRGFLLTRKDGLFMPNAGIDKSNAESGTAILLPARAQEYADVFCEQLRKRFSISNVGVVLADSRVVPFRLGISGIAIAWSGFVGISDERGKTDIFGHKLQVSQIAVADNFASLAQVFFGQAAEQTPFVLFENAPVQFSVAQQDHQSACIDPRDDLFSSIFRF